MDNETQRIFDLHFDRCFIREREPSDHDPKRSWEIVLLWKDVDRPYVGGWIHHNFKTCERMVEAIYAGVVFSKLKKTKDVNNHTYISSSTLGKVYWKHASADLKRLGF